MGRVPLAIFGGRGAGLLLADTARRMRESGVVVEVVGFLNDQVRAGSCIGSLPVLGPFEHWDAIPPETKLAAPLHKVGDMARRIERIESLGIPSERWFVTVDPTSVVGEGCRFGTDVFLGAHSVVKSMTSIGNHVAVRDGASIGHDVVQEDFTFIGTNAVVGGYVRLGRGAYVGSGALIREHVTIGAMSTIGIGAVVLDNVPEGAVVVGNPARPIRQNRD